MGYGTISDVTFLASIEMKTTRLIANAYFEEIINIILPQVVIML